MSAVRFSLCLVVSCGPLLAGTVVVTTLPDETHPLAPLTSLAGVPLATGTSVKIGAFPGLDDDEILDASASGGLTAVSAAFVAFGDACSIGEGVAGAPGSFEIAVKEPLSGAPWVGEEVSLLIEANDGQFLVARFKGQTFQADPDTGLESLLSLHLADAAVVVGNRYGANRMAASTAPAYGSFESWIGSFPAITGPELRLAGADADGDGRSNFLEYATGGNPASSGDPAPCQVVADEGGDLWVRFSRAAGIGNVRHVVETSPDLVTTWQGLTATPEPDPHPPVTGSLDWMRVRVPQPLTGKGFFRLNPQPDTD
jgi:hypothetical protein